jgi:hypothetical protein
MHIDEHIPTRRSKSAAILHLTIQLMKLHPKNTWNNIQSASCVDQKLIYWSLCYPVGDGKNCWLRAHSSLTAPMICETIRHLIKHWLCFVESTDHTIKKDLYAHASSGNKSNNNITWSDGRSPPYSEEKQSIYIQTIRTTNRLFAKPDFLTTKQDAMHMRRDYAYKLSCDCLRPSLSHGNASL